MRGCIVYTESAERAAVSCSTSREGRVCVCVWGGGGGGGGMGVDCKYHSKHKRVQKNAYVL